MTVRTAVKSLIKRVAFNTPLHHSLFNVYSYMYSPSELMFLSECLSSVRHVPGSVVEAGCAYGATTVWLNKYMDDEDIHRLYYALDTFSGFPDNQVDYEKLHRHKSPEVEQTLRSTFSDNQQSWFDKSMKLHGARRVRSIQCDVSSFNFAVCAPIAFCLIDVDLYLPIRTALPNIYDAMSPGGVIVVDDCWRDVKWDGALQAYMEFINELDMMPNIVGRKLGLINR
jgi:hypothetical protein